LLSSSPFAHRRRPSTILQTNAGPAARKRLSARSIKDCAILILVLNLGLSLDSRLLRRLAFLGRTLSLTITSLVANIDVLLDTLALCRTASGRFLGCSSYAMSVVVLPPLPCQIAQSKSERTRGNREVESINSRATPSFFLITPQVLEQVFSVLNPASSVSFFMSIWRNINSSLDDEHKRQSWLRKQN